VSDVLRVSEKSAQSVVRFFGGGNRCFSRFLISHLDPCGGKIEKSGAQLKLALEEVQWALVEFRP
jgi:hypothetical protein